MTGHEIISTILGSAAAIMFFIGAYGAAKQYQNKGEGNEQEND
tara:strand:+ start:4207 stop:4335 length:129 start_codon:yes stop_codon:yes gene_type:complete